MSIVEFIGRAQTIGNSIFKLHELGKDIKYKQKE